MKRFLQAAALSLLAAVTPARAANIQNIDLGKDAEVWFAEDHTVPVIAFNISLPAGSGYDPAGKAGLAAFAADLIDEGAGNMDSRAFHGALADHAIQFRASADRDNLVISTKLAFDYPGTSGGLSAQEIKRECEKSLRRLQTDRIDIYYSHRDDRETKLEETMEAFDALIKEGDRARRSCKERLVRCRTKLGRKRHRHGDHLLGGVGA